MFYNILAYCIHTYQNFYKEKGKVQAQNVAKARTGHPLKMENSLGNNPARVSK